MMSTDPMGFTSTMAYDKASNVIAITNARGYITSLAYDADNREVSATNALNGIATTVYDAVGNVIAASPDPRSLMRALRFAASRITWVRATASQLAAIGSLHR